MQDIRYAVKLLRQNPTFTLAALLTLALGIGATSAIFSVMNAAMLRPLPFPDPDQVVFLSSSGTTNWGPSAHLPPPPCSRGRRAARRSRPSPASGG